MSQDAEARRNVDDLVLLRAGPAPRTGACRPQSAPPPTIAARIRSVKIALPAITSGLRARFERRVGTGTCSGSSAARGQRGVMRFCSISEVPIHRCGRPDMGG